MTPNTSVGCCAVHLTGKDRTNWNEEIISQQTLRSNPGIAGLSQNKAVVSLGWGQEKPRPSPALPELSADLPPHMQGKDLVTSIFLTSFLVSHRVGREDARREAWEVTQPQRDVVHACLSLWFPRDLVEQMLGYSLSRTWLVSPATEAPLGGLQQTVWGSWDGEIPQMNWVKQLWPCASDFLNVLLDLGRGSFLWMGNEMTSSSVKPSVKSCAALWSNSLSNPTLPPCHHLISTFSGLLLHRGSHPSASTILRELPRSWVLPTSGMWVQWWVLGLNGWETRIRSPGGAQQCLAQGAPAVDPCSGEKWQPAHEGMVHMGRASSGSTIHS